MSLKSISNLSLEVVNEHGIGFAWLASCPKHKRLNCIYLNWPRVTPQSGGGRVGDASWKLWCRDINQSPGFGCWVVLLCVRVYLPCFAQTFPILFGLSTFSSCGDLSLLSALGWRVASREYYYSVADGWVEKAYRIHPFICIHPMQHFIRLHLTFKLFRGSKFNSCCQDCLLWAGYNWQHLFHLFSFQLNKIICIFPAEEKQCGYSFRTADCLAHKTYLGSAPQEKPSITTRGAKKTQTQSVCICHGTVW